jgi:hypothetical protein
MQYVKEWLLEQSEHTRSVLYKVSFGGHCFHAAVHMAAGQADVADGFALNLKLEIDGFFQGHMHGAQRQVKGA